METCCARMQSGQICGKSARYPCYGKWYCGRHKKDDNILAEYGSGLPLANLDFRLLDDDPVAEANIRSLNGYCNIRVGWPVFTHGETCPLALMSRISHNSEHFSRITLAQELVSAIKFFQSMPNEYKLSNYSLEQMRLDNIIYDYTYGIFVANISVI